MMRLMKTENSEELLITTKCDPIELPGGTIDVLLGFKPEVGKVYEYLGPVPSVLDRLPETIKYPIPSFCTEAILARHGESSTGLWETIIGEYRLEIRKIEGMWEVYYALYDAYEGGLEVMLPTRPAEEIQAEIGDERWWEFVFCQGLYSSTRSTSLEKSAEKVWEWLKERNIL